MKRPPGLELAARVVALALPLACAAYAVANAHSVLYGGVAWLIVLLCSLSGFGHLVERIVRLEVDLGLRIAWGIGAFLALAGVGFAAGVLTQPVLVALIIVGLAGFSLRQWTSRRPSLLASLDLLRQARARPLLAAYFALIAAIAGVNILAGLTETQGNTYDDDVAYTPLIKRTLDVGDIDEPFSFRRIGAFGGQTALGALGAARGTLDNVNLADGALCQLVVFLLVIGLARRRKGEGVPVDSLVLGLVLLDLVLLPNISINSGSYWSGVLAFVALYRTLALCSLPDRPQVRMFALVGVLAATTCSLRQNYIPIAVLMPLVYLLARLGRQPIARLRTDRRLWLATMAAGAITLIPFCIASYRSSHTFLYPFWSGTFNTAISPTPAAMTWWQELQLWFKVLVEPDPLRVILLLAPVIAIARDLRRGRPFVAMVIAVAVGLGLLIHTFTVADPPTLWRYAFGYVTALFLVVVLEAGGPGLSPDEETERDGPVHVPLLGRYVVIACLLIQVAISSRGIMKRYANITDDLRVAAATHDHPQRRLVASLTYLSLQVAVPPGQTIAVALDEPYFLDYARNPIINIDTPGFASYAPGMPSFRGAEPVAQYFLSHDIRYLGFVRGTWSRYQYRREFWLKRIFFDTEWWRVQSAYAVDCLDNFEELAASRRVLFERDGMVMLDLAERRP